MPEGLGAPRLERHGAGQKLSLVGRPRVWEVLRVGGLEELLRRHQHFGEPTGLRLEGAEVTGVE
eukprot:13520468-Alexandrium_andersonii.AAC.1